MEECCGSDAPRLPCVLSKAGGPHASTPHDTPPCTCTGPSIPEHGLTLHNHAKCAHALQRFAQHLPLRLRRARGGWAGGPLPAAGRRAHIRSAACTGARPVNRQHLETEAGTATSKAPTAAARWHGPAAAAPAQPSCAPVHAPHMQRPGQQGQGPWTCKPCQRGVSEGSARLLSQVRSPPRPCLACGRPLRAACRASVRSVGRGARTGAGRPASLAPHGTGRGLRVLPALWFARRDTVKRLLEQGVSAHGAGCLGARMPGRADAWTGSG